MSRTKDQVMESQISGIDGNKGQQVSDPGTGFVASRVKTGQATTYRHCQGHGINSLRYWHSISLILT